MASIAVPSVLCLGWRSRSGSASPWPSAIVGQRRAIGIGVLRLRVTVTVTVTARAAPKYKGTWEREERLTEMIEKKVEEAKEVCEGDGRTSEECKVAWDEVEEVSQAKSHLRQRLTLHNQDPLEPFCQENPETDECRVYQD